MGHLRIVTSWVPGLPFCSLFSYRNFSDILFYLICPKPADGVFI